MANQAWLDELRERLAKHALPPAYIRRFMDELSDHLEDLKEENVNADTLSRLGEPKQVAETAVVAYRQRSFLGRHPAATFLVFGVSPVLSQFVQVILGWIVFSVLGMIAERFGFFSDHGKFVSPNPVALEVTSYVYDLIFVILPTILAAVLYCKLAKRLALGKKWMFVSCFVLAAMAMLPCGYVRLGVDAAGHSFLSGGFGLPSLHNWFAWNSQMSEIVQLSVPLVIGWWFFSRWRQDKLQLAS